MFHLLLASFLEGPFAIPIVAICVGVGVPVIAHYWFEFKKHEADNELKRAMVERGMSADEIERVLAIDTDEARRARTSAN